MPKLLLFKKISSNFGHINISKAMQRKNKSQMIREHLQRKQRPNRQYSHCGYCLKKETRQITFGEAIAYLFQFAIFVGIGILIYKLI